MSCATCTRPTSVCCDTCTRAFCTARCQAQGGCAATGCVFTDADGTQFVYAGEAAWSDDARCFVSALGEEMHGAELCGDSILLFGAAATLAAEPADTAPPPQQGRGAPRKRGWMRAVKRRAGGVLRAAGAGAIRGAIRCKGLGPKGMALCAAKGAAMRGGAAVMRASKAELARKRAKIAQAPAY
jgi:hypothetical protein